MIYLHREYSGAQTFPNRRIGPTMHREAEKPLFCIERIIFRLPPVNPCPECRTEAKFFKIDFSHFLGRNPCLPLKFDTFLRFAGRMCEVEWAPSQSDSPWGTGRPWPGRFRHPPRCSSSGLLQTLEIWAKPLKSAICPMFGP